MAETNSPGSGDIPPPHGFARQVLKEMQIMGKMKTFPLEPSDIQDAVTGILPVKILGVRYLPIERTNSVWGRLRRIDRTNGDIMETTHFEIDLDSRLDRAHQRLVGCKELCHILYSEQHRETRSRTFSEVVALIRGVAASQTVPPYSPALTCERDALIAAIEILCPFAHRQVFMEDLKAKRIDNKELNRIFGIPEWLTKIVFSDPFHENAMLAWDGHRD